MKTDKFTTKRKFDFAQAQTHFIDIGTNYLKTWTQKELIKYRNQPVVIPFGDHGFLIGPYKVQGIQQNCWNVSQHDGKYIHDFSSKISAIIYCLYIVLHRHATANSILDVDARIGRLENNIKHYEHSLKVAQKHKNSAKADILLNRCIDAKMQRRILNDILKKTLNSAKYLNFRNNQNEIN